MGPQGIAEGLHVVVAAKQVQQEVQGRQAGASGVQEGGSPRDTGEPAGAGCRCE